MTVYSGSGGHQLTHTTSPSRPQKLGPQAQDKWEGYGAELVQQAVQAAQAEGFPLQGKPEGEKGSAGAAWRLAVTCTPSRACCALRLGPLVHVLVVEWWHAVHICCHTAVGTVAKTNESGSTVL